MLLRRGERLRLRLLLSGLDGHVAADHGPVVVELAEHRADQADDALAVGEDADDVGAAADLAVEPLLRVVGPDLPPVLFRDVRKGKDLLLGDGEIVR